MSLTPIFVVLLLAYALVSRRLERTLVTGPMVFTGVGVLLFLALPALQSREADMPTFLALAEVALVLLLFADSSRTNLRVLKDIQNLPSRLLSLGMLLTIGLGMAAAKLVLPGLSWWEAGILSAILAPTDAGLGMVIVNSPRVPTAVRQSLNVEAGLNDGLSVPFMLFFIAMAMAGVEGTEASLVQFMVEQLGYGALLGAAVGLLGGALLGRAEKARWMQESMRGIGVVALPALCLIASKPLGASAFIAAFVAGLTSQVGFPTIGKHSVEFTEEWGQVLSFLVFFLFGVVVAGGWAQVTGGVLLYAVLSLTVARMLPVAVALVGTGMSRATVLFMGWFGPRGLASIVLGLVFLEQEAHLPGEPLMRAAVIATVMMSIFAHGASATPGIAWYARQVEALGAGAPELAEEG